MLLLSIASLLTGVGCSTECEAGSSKNEEGTCVTDPADDTAGGDADTDTDTDTDTDADTDADTDTDPAPTSIRVSGTGTVIGGTITAEGVCGLSVWGSSQVDPTTGQPLDPVNDRPMGGTNLVCPLEEGGGTLAYALDQVEINGEASVYINLFIDTDGPASTTGVARTMRYEPGPLTVEAGGVYENIDITVDLAAGSGGGGDGGDDTPAR